MKKYCTKNIRIQKIPLFTEVLLKFVSQIIFRVDFLPKDTIENF